MAKTLRDMINSSARLINIIQQNESLSAEEMNTAVYALDALIESWSNNRLMIYNIKEYVFPLTGQKTYTLGIGGDWDVQRPMAIETAYARLQPNSPQQLDIAMQPLTVEQYAGVAVKNTPSTFPFAYYDDGDYPLRNVTLFPVPNGPADIVLWLREPLLDLTDIDAPVTYPPGYERAFRFNLAVELAAEYGKTVAPEVVQTAINAKLELERLNSVPRYMRGDGGMSRSGRNRYFNWITGNFWSFGNN
jgi:hypothetical protein